MATSVACPACGTPMREIVWGYGTIADVADAGDVVIGGCVIDVDAVGRVAALQCPVCGARADQHGVELERPEPPATTVHPFDVAFSSPQPTRREVTMTEHTQPDGSASVPEQADGSIFVDDDFGGVASGGDWRDHVEPYASREDQLPQASPPARERVDPYASREDQPPGAAGSGWRDRLDPFSPQQRAAAADAAPGAAVPDDAAPDDAAPDDAAPDDAAPGEAVPGEAAPGEHTDARWLDTSDTTDAEEEGWPSRY